MTQTDLAQESKKENQATRIAKINEIQKSEPLGKEEIMWQDQLTSMDVYKVPLAYLQYNKYNGRILSDTKSLEAQGSKIDATTPDGKKIVEELLWYSKVDRNSRTRNDLEKNGQKVRGVITRDGIIIDGNRRAMLLNRIKGIDYFKAIILPVTLEENKIEINRFETSYQMGEDEKLDYRPIEKYLKAKDLKGTGVSISDIADWMGESKDKIEDYIQIMKTMDDYLDSLDYHNQYTQLDKKEDQFINLTNWVDNFSNNGEYDSAKGFSGYTQDNVDDLIIRT